MHRRFATAFTAIALFAPVLCAQTRGVSFFASPGGPATTRGITSGYFPHFQRRPFPQQTVFLGDPFLYPDYSYGLDVVAPAQPQVIVVQATPPVKQEESNKPGALLIEWDGTHYVRSDSTAALANLQENPRLANTAPTSSDLRPVLLVFRDGQRQQVNEYTIADGILYAHGEYWIDGYWNRQIRLSSLDLPATFAANQQNGVTFILPSAANQVVTRP